MVAIKTKRNWVCAYDRRPDDILVQVDLIGPVGDGIHLRPKSLGCFPIANYSEWVDWAVAIADQMAHPIHVLPLNHDDIFNTGRFERYRKFLANMNEHERTEVRQIIIDSLASIMRDSYDFRLRTKAFNMLQQLGVATT